MVVLYQGREKLFLEKAMKIVGHSEYQTTADIYTHLDQEMMQATAEDGWHDLLVRFRLQSLLGLRGYRACVRFDIDYEK